ncbi:MAG: BACON domain-containing protein [Bryobacterales bacterium]|nr:BACON domain-containing protein [Bryobacterales bacterium]
MTIRPAPSITSLNPSSTVIGGPTFNLFASGQNFYPGDRIVFDGETLSTSFSNSSLLSTSVPSYYLSYVGSATVSISTADGFVYAETPFPIGNPINVTVTTNPVGRPFTVDGITYNTTTVFQWAPGSPHTIAVTSPQDNGDTRFTFQNWSNSGPISQSVSPTAAITYTAFFSTSHKLTTISSGNGTVSPSTSYRAANENVSVTATPDPGRQFNGWSGDATGSNNPVSVLMNGPKTVTASFGPAPISITVTTDPIGRQFVVDGQTYTSPAPPFQWAAGSPHTIGVTSPQDSGDTRFTFQNWSDNLPISHSVSPPATITYTAFFSMSHKLTTNVSPSSAGTVTPSSGNYHAAGSPVQVTASANPGYTFSGWSGDLSGASNSAQLMMNAPKSITANFVSTNVTTSPASLSFIGGAGGLAIGSQNLTVTSSLPYTVSAQSSGSWLSVAPASGPGPHTVSISNIAGMAAGTYSGSINITTSAGNSSVPVTLTLVSCTPALQPSSNTVGAAGGTGFSFTALFNNLPFCNVSLQQPNAPWLTGNSSPTAGGLRVDYSVAANSGSQRTGVLEVNGAVFTVTQTNAPATCTVSASPTQTSFPQAGGTATVNVTVTGTGCSWTGAPGVPWISFPSGAAGAGSGSFVFSVESNPSSQSRQGSITVKDQTITIQQSGGGSTCQPTLTPGSATVGSGATNGVIEVGGSCNWVVDNSSSFVTIQSGSQGTSPGTIRYSVASNPGISPRSGVISIGGRSFRLTQNATDCTFQIASAPGNAPAGASSQSITVRTVPGCSWNASTPADWITIVSGANGSADGKLVLSLTSNSGGQRSAVVTVAGQSLIVTQESGSNCPVVLDAASATFDATGSPIARVLVNSPSSCSWNVVPNAPFVSVLSGPSGSGSGTVSYSVQPGQAARQGTLTIGGRTFTVRQLSPACEYSLSNVRGTVPATGGDVTLQVSATSPSCLPVPSGAPPQWVMQSVTANAGRQATLLLRAGPNPGVARETAWKIGDQSFTLTQTAQGEFTCALRTPVASQARSEGRTELAGELVLECNGNSTVAMTGDVLVRFNTNFTSKPEGSATEALLLVEDAVLPPSLNTIHGIVASNNAVRFPDVPLASAGPNATRTFRMTNLRLDASLPNLPEALTATVTVIGPFRNIVVQNDSQTVARRVASLQTSIGTAQPVSGGLRIPVTFRERIPNAFRNRYAEDSSRFILTIHPGVSMADSGTRLIVKLRSLPLDAKVSAPLYPDSGQSAQLVPDDPNGAGTGLRTAAVPGNSLVDIPVVNGEATLAWEILSADPASIETHTFTIFVSGATNLESRLTASMGPFAPNTARPPVPSFLDPAAPLYRMPVVRLTTKVTPNALTQESAARRAPTPNRSAIIETTATCETSGGCPDFTATGNASSGSGFTGCQSEATCSNDGRGGSISSPGLAEGQQVKGSFQTELNSNAPVSSIGAQFGSHGSTSEAAECLARLDALPALPVTASQGTFRVYACGIWYLSSSVTWIRFTPAFGQGDMDVQYTVEPNTGGVTRSAVIQLASSSNPRIQVVQTGNPTPGAGLRFVPVAPCRLLDTRTLYAGTTWTGLYGPPTLVAGQTRRLPVAGGAHCGIPASAKAFALNVTVDTVENRTGPVDYLTVYPTGQSMPEYWTVRTTTGGYIANSAIVPAGSDGSVSIFSSNNVNAVIDINGYFTDDPAAPGLLYYPFGPCRAVDTRDVYNSLPPPFGHQRFQADETRSFRLPSSPNCAGLKAASAYSLQMTLTPGPVDNGGAVAFITAWAQDTRPQVSNMNALQGYAVANSSIVPAAAGGSINVYSPNVTNLLLDVNGYFAPDDGSGAGLYYFPVRQCRLLNTQDPTLPGVYGPAQMLAATDRVVPIAGSPRCPGLPTTAKAWALNATAIPNGTGLPFLSMWPAAAPWPQVSQLNAFQGQTLSNSGIVSAGPNGAIQVKVNATTHVALEVAGYFAR